jgi:cytochrome P450
MGWRADSSTSRLLARHPGVLDRLRSEVESVVGLGESAPPPTREDLKQMPYLSFVIKEGTASSLPISAIASFGEADNLEVLRLYPSVPVNSREAIRLTTLPIGGGPDGKSPVLVRPGEGVGYCVYAMHRRKDIYGLDADEFRPERWEDDSLSNVGWGYLPFNGGPRLCLGRKLTNAGHPALCQS